MSFILGITGPQFEDIHKSEFFFISDNQKNGSLEKWVNIFF